MTLVCKGNNCVLTVSRELKGAPGVAARRQLPSLALDGRAGCQVLSTGRRVCKAGETLRCPPWDLGSPQSAGCPEWPPSITGHLLAGPAVQTCSWSRLRGVKEKRLGRASCPPHLPFCQQCQLLLHISAGQISEQEWHRQS